MRQKGLADCVILPGEVFTTTADLVDMFGSNRQMRFIRCINGPLGFLEQ